MKTIYFPLFLLFGLIYTTFAQTITSFFSTIETEVIRQLTSAEEGENDVAIDWLIAAFGYAALVDADFENIGQIDTDEIADDVVEILRDGLAEDQCDDIFADFDQVAPVPERRRRLQDSVAEAASFFLLLAENVDWELLRMPLDLDLDEDLSLELDNEFANAALGTGLIALINADCDATELSILRTSASALALLRGTLGDGGGDDDDDDDDLDDLLTLLLLANAAGDSDDDDSSDDDDDGNDARTVNEAKDNLDFDIEQNEDGSDVVTLKMATSTMTNMWIALIVFCGFNMSFFWFFMARKKKQSVHYETAEDVPSVSVNY